MFSFMGIYFSIPAGNCEANGEDQEEEKEEDEDDSPSSCSDIDGGVCFALAGRAKCQREHCGDFHQVKTYLVF